MKNKLHHIACKLRYGSVCTLLLLASLKGSAQNWGFEATPATSPPNNISVVTGTWPVNTNATYVRTGTQSMSITDPATTGTTGGTTTPFLTTTSTGYLIAIGWGKSNSATNASFYMGYRSGTTNTPNPSTTTTPTNAYWLNNTGWTRIVAVSAVGTLVAGNYGWSVRAFRNTSTTGTTLYFDDMIVYGSSSNVPDLTAPSAATGATATGNVLTWTNGTDNGAPASGIGGVVIIRADGVSLTAPTLNDQAMYNPVHGAAGVGSFSDGTNTWTVVANISGSSTASFTDASATGGPYTYAIYMRDMAYNYSTAVTAGAATACIDPPTPGTVTSSVSSSICPGTSVNLGLTGNSFGLGQTYQWQVSASAGGTYTNVGAASTSPSITVTPTVTSYYRCEVVCSGGSPVYSAPVQVLVSQPVSGTFTINGTASTGAGNFNTFADAVASLSCGISGPVVFNVAAGTYNEQVILPAVSGTSATNTITFNGNGATLTYLSTNTNERATLKLNGTDWVTVNNLNIAAPATGTSDFGYGVHLLNDADHNTISNCTITANQSATSTSSYAGIVINSTATAITTAGACLCDNNTITGNTINGGYAGVAIVANTSTSTVTGNSITNNIIKNFYEYGIYANGNDQLLIENNDISRPDRTSVTTFRGVGLFNINTNTKVNANRLHNPFGAAATSSSAAFNIFLSNCDATVGNENIISNNVIYDHIGGTGNHNGMLIVSSDNVKIYHNTILLNDVAATCTACAARGIYFQTAPATGIDIKNNVISIIQGGTAPKQCIYFEGTGNITFTASNNDYYMGSIDGTTNQIGWNNTLGYSTLAAWQTATSQDANSISTDPLFQSVATGNLTPTNNIDNLGTYVGINTDFAGNARNATTPDMGAYEFSVGGCTAPPTAGTAGSSATGVICANTAVQLSLAGNSSGAGQTYTWQSSGASTGTYTDISSPATQPAFTVNPANSTYYRAAVTCNGQTSYSAPVYVPVNTGLSGIYSIDANSPTDLSSGGTNFASFADAMTAMACGITGPVTLNVAANSGPYNEQFTLTAAMGGSATTPIVINGGGNLLTFSASAAATKAGITLNGADYVTINNLNIDGSAGTMGWGIFLTNQADHNTITNCNISVSTSNTTTGNHIGIGFNSGTSVTMTSGNNGNYNTISNNTITGGYYGIAVYGSSTTSTVGNTVTNNTVKEAYAYHIYIFGTNDAVVSGNDISRPTRTGSTTAAGVYVTSGAVNILVENNRVHNLFDAMTTNTSSAYGVYVGSTASAGMENEVINNVVYDNVHNGIIYGVYNSGAGFCNIYHNTIVLNGASATAGAAYGFYQTTSATNIVFRNNLVSISKGGSGVKYCVYKSTAATPLTSDNNAFYLNSAGTGAQSIGYQTSAQTTLAAWQSASSQDANSVVADPIFTNPAIGDFTPATVSINNIGAPLGVASDIMGNVRSVSNPDPGAYEFSVATCSGAPVAGTASGPTNTFCAPAAFSLSLSGYSLTLGVTFQWEQYNTATSSWDAIPGATATTASVSSISSTTDFRAAVTCSYDGSIAYSNVVSVSVSNPMVTGTTPGSACDGSSATLSATGSAGTSIRWYSAATGGSPLATGTSFTTPALMATTDYYAAAATAGVTEGVPSPTATTSTFHTPNVGWGLRFTANATATINTVNVYASNTTAGVATMQIKVTDLSDVVLYTGTLHTFNVGTALGMETIPVNITVPPGNYKMVMTSTGINALVRESSGSTFPYTSASGAISVTAGANGVGSAQTTSSYYWFYAWNITTGCESARVPVTATVTPLVTPSVTVNASATTVCNGGTSTLVATPTNGGSAPMYQWYKNGGAITGATNFNYTASGINDGDQFHVEMTSNAGCATTTMATSNTVTINAYVSSATITANGPTTICSVGGSVTLTAGQGQSYLWSNGLQTQSINVTSGGTYSVTVTSGAGCVDVSAPVTITSKVMPSTAKIKLVGASTVCSPNEVAFVLDMPLGSTTGFGYQWNLGGSPIAGATDSVYSADATGAYTVTISGGSSCTKTSAAKTATIKATPVADFTVVGATSFCSGGTVTFTAASAGTGATYAWLKNGNTNAGSGATKAFSASGDYSLVVTLAGCKDTSNYSELVTVHPAAPLSKVAVVGGTTVCAPATVALMLDAAVSSMGSSFQWNLDGTPIPGANDSTYAADTTGMYTLTLTTPNGCIKTSSAKKATVKPLPVADFTAAGPTEFCFGGNVTLTAPSVPGVTYTWLKDGVNAGSGTAKAFKLSGVYTVVATLAGCKDTADYTETITVNPLPVAAVSTMDPATFCAGGSATLHATPTGNFHTYAWYKTNVLDASVITEDYVATQAGTYKVIVTDDKSCVSKMSTSSVVIKVNAIPVAGISAAGPTTFSMGGNVKLKATPTSGVTWQWNLDGQPIAGATGKEYIATAAGDYTVEVTKLGCTGTSSVITVTVVTVKEEPGTTSNPAGTEEASEIFELSAFPNPVSGILNVNVRGIEEVDATLHVMDMNGKLVAEQHIHEASATVDMTGYANGMYLIRYKDNQGRTGTIKVTKQ